MDSLIFQAKLLYHGRMQSGPFPRLRGIASSLMLLAVAAFVLQGAMTSGSQAAGALGFMPHPAVPLSGAVHLHDNLAGHVHVHGGDNLAGHVHGSDDGHHDPDEASNGPLCSLGCMTAVIPAAAGCVALFMVRALEYMPQAGLVGIEPDGLNRPPSTPGIA